MNARLSYPYYASLGNADYYLVDGDIILIIPTGGYKDSPEQSQASVEFQNKIVREVGRPCGIVIVMSNVLAQDAESRRIYNAHAANGLYSGVAIVVDNPLSRALGSFLLGMRQTQIPLHLVDTIENGINWLRTIRQSVG